jgi:hypothetical protein
MSFSLLGGFALGILACWGRPFITQLITYLAYYGAFAGKESGKDLAVNISKLTKEVRRLSRNVRRILIEVEGLRKSSKITSKNPTKRRTKNRTPQVCDQKVRPVAENPQKSPEINNKEETKTAIVAQASVLEKCAPTVRKRSPKPKSAAKNAENCQNLLRSSELLTWNKGRLPRIGEILCLESYEDIRGETIRILHPTIVEKLGKQIEVRHAVTGEQKSVLPEVAKTSFILLKADPTFLQGFLLRFFILPKEKPKIRFKDWVAKTFSEPGGKKE